MRILYESDLAGSKYHGMAYRIYQFSREFVERGHEVMIVAASYSHVRRINPIVNNELTDEQIDGINYKWIKTPKYQGNGVGRVVHMFLYNLKLWFYAKKIAKSFNPDVVIASGVSPLDFIGCYRIAKCSGAKICLEVGDLWPLTPMELGGYSSKHPFIRVMQKVENFAYRHTDTVISLLPCAEEYMMLHGLKEGKFHNIPNGIIVKDWMTPEQLPQSHQSIIKRLKKEGKFMVGFSGTHSISNALFTLLDVAIQLLDENIVFVLVGDGPIKDELRKCADSRNINNVYFLPSISKSIIPSFLEAMDILYIGFQKQSLYRFGISPNKIFDYMMASKPILQAIDAGNDIVKEAQCGVSVDAENVTEIVNGILRLKNMPIEEREKLGKNGYEYVLKYHSYDVLTERYLNILTNLVKS